MKQTNQYKLNLIEKDDTFSPDPLNDNTAKLEAALNAASAASAAQDAALEQRIIVLEGHKIAVGTYTGNGADSQVIQTIRVGFSPRVVWIQNATSASCFFTTNVSNSTNITFLADGFTVRSSGMQSPNTNNGRYSFCAIL